MTRIDLGYWGQVLTDLEELMGPLREVSAPISAFGVYEGSVGGVPARATWLGAVGGEHNNGSTLHLGVSLGDRPIKTYVWRRKGSTIFGPTATSGDTRFDETYIVSARPPEVVSHALDPDVRSIIERRWPDTDTSLDAKNGWVTLAAGSSRHGRRGRREPPTKAQLAAMLDDLSVVAERLRGSYDRKLAAVAAEGGAEAAVAWEAECRADVAAQRRTGRAVAVAAILTVVVAVAAVVSIFV